MAPATAGAFWFRLGETFWARRYAKAMRALPALLIALRGTLGAVLLALGLSGRTGWPFARLLIAGLLSDIFDGVLARRLGVASARLRLTDSVTDGILSCVWEEGC